MSQSTIQDPPSCGRQVPFGERIRTLYFGSLWNSMLTVVGLTILVCTLPALFRWALVDATWNLSPEECLAVDGACWSYVRENMRFVLFGLYPFSEQWRPVAAIVLFICMILFSARPRHWSKRLVYGWCMTFAVIGVLLHGGILGLPLVETDRWSGLPLTLLLAVMGIVAAYPFGIMLALGRRSTLPIIRSLSTIYIEVVRGIPLICLLFLSSVVFPLFLPKDIVVNKLLRAQVAIILSSAAYLAEVIRGGLQVVESGQYEAADAIGLSYVQKMRLVVLPQALKTAIPPTVNTFISMFKDTSLVIIIALYDLLKTTQTTLSDPTWMAFSTEAYLFAAATYFPFCFFMSRYSRYLETYLGWTTDREEK